MAERRMFTKKVTDDDNFVSLSSSAQALYLHLSMSADDDGFSNQIAVSMFRAHASTQDLQALLEKRYVYQFENGVIVIKHWRMANALRKDRYTPTAFQEELAKLELKDNGSYTWLPDGCQMVANRLPQDSIDIPTTTTNNNINNNNIYTAVAPQPTVAEYREFVEAWNSIPHTVNITDIIPLTARDDEFRICLSVYGKEGVMNAIQKIRDSEYLQKRNAKARWDKFINRNVIQNVLEGSYDEDYNKVEETDGIEFSW